MNKVQFTEWRWVLIFACSVMALTCVPYLIPAFLQTAEMRFVGFVINIGDIVPYIAKARLGAEGAWLFTPLYTSEPSDGVLIFAFYMLLGKLVGTNYWALVFAYHAARVLLGIATIVLAYRLSAEVLETTIQRRWSTFLIALGGGLGWLLIGLGKTWWIEWLPIDFYSPEAFTFISLFATPHLLAARCLLWLSVWAYLRRQGMWAGLALFGVSLIQPIYVLALWAVMGADTAVRLWRTRQLVEARIGLTVVAASLPMVMYTVWAFQTNPVLSGWNAQSVQWSPHPLQYLFAYGLYLVPVIFGWQVLQRTQPAWAQFALVWALVLPVLLYFPVPFQRRLAEGFQWILILVAVLGLTRPPQSPQIRQIILNCTNACGGFGGMPQPAGEWAGGLKIFYNIATILTSLLLLFGAGVAAFAVQPPMYVATDQLAAFAWLNQNGKRGDVGLSAYETGNLLPAFTPVIAYVGLVPETLNAETKRAQVKNFYQPTTSEVERLQLLKDGRIRYVLYGATERAFSDGRFDPSKLTYLQLRFTQGAFQIYEVHNP